jgi:hypothetical protein
MASIPLTPDAGPTAAHGADAWLRPVAARSHRTGTVNVGLGQTRAQAMSVVTQRIEDRGHATATTMILVGAGTHITGARARAELTQVHATATIVAGLARATPRAASPGYTSPLGIWLGGASQANFSVPTSHGTSTLTVFRRVLTYSTDTMEQGIPARVQISDTLTWFAATPIHGTNTVAYARLAQAHQTDVLIRTAAARVHTTGSLIALLRTSARVQLTNSLARSTSTRSSATDSRTYSTALPVNITDGLLRATTVRSHATSTRCRATAVRSQTTSTLCRATPIWSFMTDALRRATGSHPHATSILRFASVSRAHATDIRTRSAIVHVHTTDVRAAVRVSAAVLHTTDVDRHGIVVRTHAADGLKLSPGAWVYNTDAATRIARLQTHGTSTQVAQLAARLRANLTDTRSRWISIRSHGTDTLVMPAVVGLEVYSTDIVLMLVAQPAHGADALVAQLMATPQTHAADADLMGHCHPPHGTATLFSVLTAAVHTTDTRIATRATQQRVHVSDTLLRPLVAFVQRDNWRNGINWIGQYGAQGYSLYSYNNVPDVLPPSCNYTVTNLGIVPNWVTGTGDPRYLQVPNSSTTGAAVYYVTTGPPGLITFQLNDKHPHAVTLYSFDKEKAGRKQTWAVYDVTGTTLLDGPRDCGDFGTTGIYMTWNVDGPVQFQLTDMAGPGANAVTSAWFIDRPITVGARAHGSDVDMARPFSGRAHSSDTMVRAATAVFVQRDNWRACYWIGQYGAQGYSLFQAGGGAGTPDVLPPWLTYSLSGTAVRNWDDGYPPYFLEIPNSPDGITWISIFYTGTTATVTFQLTDGLPHALTLFSEDGGQGWLGTIAVYDVTGTTLLDGPRDVGPMSANGIYMTWNVTGSVQFLLTATNGNMMVDAWFVDRPITVGGKAHGSDSLTAQVTTARAHSSDALLVPAGPATFVQRDNWRNGGRWIGTYGLQGYSIFQLSGTPDVLPPNCTVIPAGGGLVQDWFASNPGYASDLRLIEIPSKPGAPGLSIYYTNGTYTFTFNCDDGAAHAVALYFTDPTGNNWTGTVTAKDVNTGAVLDPVRNVGDDWTTGVYLVWNIIGHVQFELSPTVAGTNFPTAAWFIDRPRAVGGQVHGNDSLTALPTPAAPAVAYASDSMLQKPAALFVQRDNWRNGFWLDQYGAQGYSLFDYSGVPDILPPGCTYSVAGCAFANPWHSGSDPRYLQVPSAYGTTPGAAVYYTTTTGTVTFRLNDNLPHAVTLFSVDIDRVDRRQTWTVYDSTGTRILDGPRDCGDFGTTAVYMTWNVQGSVQFVLTFTVNANAVLSAWFIDRPLLVGGQAHAADSLAQTFSICLWAQTTSTDCRGAVIRAHATNSRIYRTVAAVHSTDLWTLATGLRAHGTDSQVARLSTSAPAHTTDSSHIHTASCGHGTSSAAQFIFAQAHGTDAGTRLVSRSSHATSSWLMKPGVGLLMQTTDVDCAGTRLRIHNTGSLLSQITVRKHAANALARQTFVRAQTADSLLVRPATLIHATDVLWQQPAIRAHATDLRTHGTYAANQATDSCAFAAHTVTTTTDTGTAYLQVRRHATDSRPMRLTTRAHTADAMLSAQRATSHGTDTGKLGLSWRPSYIDGLKRGTLVRTHNTNAYAAVVRTTAHGTNAATYGLRLQTHATSALLVQSRSYIISTDASLLRLPAARHQTNTAAAVLRAHAHQTSTMTTIAPIVGRWAAQRVMTRQPAQLASHDRQETNTTYGVGFLLVGPDRITPVLGATPTVRLLKSGTTSWVPAIGTVREIGQGWYELIGSIYDRNVAGETILMATAPGAETAWTKFDVVVSAPYAYISFGTTELAAIADATLTRSFGSAALVAARSVLQAARSLFQWNAAQGMPLKIVAENTTTAWQANTTTDPTINPIRGVDPM